MAAIKDNAKAGTGHLKAGVTFATSARAGMIASVRKPRDIPGQNRRGAGNKGAFG